MEMKPIDIEKIIKALPHRYPMLLVDRVLNYEAGKCLTAIKNVTINEPFFQGHFPEHPVMPGVLIIEAMAQASGILACLSLSAEQLEGAVFYLVKVDKAKFSSMVTPGDQMILTVEQKRILKGMGVYACSASVDGKEVARAEILSASRRR